MSGSKKMGRNPFRVVENPPEILKVHVKPVPGSERSASAGSCPVSRAGKAVFDFWLEGCRTAIKAVIVVRVVIREVLA